MANPVAKSEGLEFPGVMLQVPPRFVPPTNPAPATVADRVAEQLYAMGVRHAFGVGGGGVAPMWSALLRSQIKTMHFRHEAGAAFAAMEASFMENRPTVIFATTGPGITNAITGVMEARWQGSKVLLLSGYTPTARQGRGVFQESSARTLGAELFTAGALFHYAAPVERVEQLPEALNALAVGFARKDGFIAHLSISPAVQTVLADGMTFEVAPPPPPPPVDPVVLARCERLLSHGPFAIWVGFGARHAGPAIRELAERFQAPVMCSPRGKGIFPENHPLFVGVTGHGGHASVFKYMTQHRPERVLVLGTRLSEFTSFANPTLVPSNGFIHVDLDPSVPGAVYDLAPTVPVKAEIGDFLAALLQAMPAPKDPYPRPLLPRPERFDVVAVSHQGVAPESVINALQRIVVDDSDAPVLAEVGSSLAWCTHGLRFTDPARFRLSTAFASMGHGMAGVIGAALAHGGKAVVVGGDGAMLMQNEVSTAVQYDIPAVWVILNDSCYGMVDQGMTLQKLGERDTQMPSTDFAMIAFGMGARSLRITHESELVPALRQAMSSPGPFVLDIVVDPTHKAPLGDRVKSLSEQGAVGRG